MSFPRWHHPIGSTRKKTDRTSDFAPPPQKKLEIPQSADLASMKEAGSALTSQMQLLQLQLWRAIACFDPPGGFFWSRDYSTGRHGLHPSQELKGLTRSKVQRIETSTRVCFQCGNVFDLHQMKNDLYPSYLNIMYMNIYIYVSYIHCNLSMYKYTYIYNIFASINWDINRFSVSPTWSHRTCEDMELICCAAPSPHLLQMEDMGQPWIITWKTGSTGLGLFKWLLLTQ